MRFILSFAAIFIVSSAILTDPMPVTALVAGGFVLAFSLIGILLYFGKRNHKPRIGDVGFINSNTVTVVAAFDSFFDIPESVKAIQQPDLERDHHMTNIWVVGVDKRGRAFLSPYFQVTKNDSNNSKQD